MTNLYKAFLESGKASTDSRTVEPGSLFFALRGENFDGNRYAAAALEKGAAIAVVDDPSAAVSEKYVLVPDVLAALQDLAREHRRTLGAPVLAITGTNGKTTTKELTARVLASKYNLSVTRGNLNNHIGVPLTILSMTAETEFAVVEMGASARGEIALLCSIAEPDYGIITNIGKAHLEGFGGIEGVRIGKAELYDWLSAHEGTAFYDTDNYDLAELIYRRPRLKAVGFSVSKISGIRNPLAGDYNLKNIAAAAAVGRYFEVPEREIQNAIESYLPDNNRSQYLQTGENRLIIDCYNANPSSMSAALDNLAAEKAVLKKSIILGDMHELGEFSEREHETIIEKIAKEDFTEVYLVGKEFGKAYENLSGKSPANETLKLSSASIQVFSDIAELIKYLTENPLTGRLILIKGSRAEKLEKLVTLL